VYVKEILMQEIMRRSKKAGRKSGLAGTQYRAPESTLVALRLMCAMLRRSGRRGRIPWLAGDF
jgi:hypothetical protein